jgi:hypothetical protein
MDHPPHSPDLASCKFWLFPKLKNALKGRRFVTFPTFLRGIPENDFQDFPAVALSTQGEYFEGNSSHWWTGKQILLLQGHSRN